jgi:hypothetical protein
MAVLFEQTLPADAPIGMLDAVTEEMGVDRDPPQGMIVHAHFERDGQVHIVDIWESVDDHDRFAETRLAPAMRKVADARGFQLPDQQPSGTITDIHRVVRGK